MDNVNLIKSEIFGNISCDFYKNKSNEILMTREQIGRALEYENPRDAMYRIHKRHKDRLDKFSGVDKVSTPSGIQEVFYYTYRGVYEICRWSRQPKANAFMDWVWDIIEKIRLNHYNNTDTTNREKYLKAVNKTLSLITDQEVLNTVGHQLILYAINKEVANKTFKPLPQIKYNQKSINDKNRIIEIKSFLKNCCDVNAGEDNIVKTSLLYNTYISWCRINSVKPLGRRKVQSILNNLGFAPIKLNEIDRYKYYKNLKFKDQ